MGGLESLVHLSASRDLSLDETTVELLMKQTDCHARHSALHIIANMLQNSTLQAGFRTDEHLRKLMDDLSHQDLHIAHLASKCLLAICQQCPATKHDLERLGAISSMSRAYHSGQSSHKSLEDSANMLQSEMGC